MVYWALRTCGTPRPKAPLEKAWVEVTRHSSVEPDYDNRAYAAKALIDGLVEHGLLAGDEPKHIGAPAYLWVKARRGAGWVRIVVSDVELE